MTAHAFHILSLFPDTLKPYLDASILGQAQKDGIIAVHYHQLRDYATGRHRSVDDRPYGGGPGMVFKPEVVCRAVREIKKKCTIGRVVLPSPRGRLFTHAVACEMAAYPSVLIICGRYEGVDQRAIDLVVDEEISIGDYVITGGELAALVLVDATTRLIPGVVGDALSPLNDSHAQGLLEHPQYTRPAEFEGLQVPDVLQSGNHEKIAAWQRKVSLEITRQRRPELLNKK